MTSLQERYNRTMREPPKNIEAPDESVVEILRSKTPAERLAIGCAMWSSARRMLLSVISQQHPDWGQDRVAKEVARRLSHGAV
jgi:hypothetical protein